MYCYWAILWRIHIAGNTKLLSPHLQVQGITFLLDFKHVQIFRTEVNKSHQYQFSRKSGHWEPLWYMRIDVMNQIGAFREYAKEPKNTLLFNLRKPTGYVMYQQVGHSATVCTAHTVFVFCIYMRTNSDLCHLKHKLIGFYIWDEKCLQRGTNWAFK